MIYDKVKKTCERILALEDNFKLEMDSYVSIADADIYRIVRRGESHPCGTTYCIAGILAHLDDYPEKYESDSIVGGFHYTDYIHGFLINANVRDGEHMPCSYDIFGIDDWLFDAKWPDSLDHAQFRAQYLLDNEFKVPEFSDTDRSLSLSEFKLIISRG